MVSQLYLHLMALGGFMCMNAPLLYSISYLFNLSPFLQTFCALYLFFFLRCDWGVGNFETLVFWDMVCNLEFFFLPGFLFAFQSFCFFSLRTLGFVKFLYLGSPRRVSCCVVLGTCKDINKFMFSFWNSSGILLFG